MQNNSTVIVLVLVRKDGNYIFDMRLNTTLVRSSSAEL